MIIFNKDDFDESTEDILNSINKMLEKNITEENKEEREEKINGNKFRKSKK